MIQEILGENIQFDFNGIAKGAAVDMIADYLEELEIDRYMVEIGGDIIVSGLNYTFDSVDGKINMKFDVSYTSVNSGKIFDMALITEEEHCLVAIFGFV